jgi:Cu/Zn superoxide dismutase
MKSAYRYPAVAALALGVALLPACAGEPETDEELDTPAVEEPAGEPANPPGAEGHALITSNFEPVAGATTAGPVTGTVTVLEGIDPMGDYKIAVRIEGLTPGEHAWHIHSGSCGGAESPVVLSFTETKEGPGIGQPLTAGESGMAEATVTVPKDKLTLDQIKNGDYSLHVHEKGGIDHGASVACAAL